MDITPLVSPSRRIIRAYGGGGFTVNEDRFDHSILLFPDRVEVWPQAGIGEAGQASLAEALQGQGPALLLIGTGVAQAMLPPAFKRRLKEQCGLAAEAMDTGAACRTYNILVAEDRPVIAALIAV